MMRPSDILAVIGAATVIAIAVALFLFLVRLAPADYLRPW